MAVAAAKTLSRRRERLQVDRDDNNLSSVTTGQDREPNFGWPVKFETKTATFRRWTVGSAASQF